MHKILISKRSIFLLILIGFSTFPALLPANAHMSVSSSNPSNGSQIATSPDELSIIFTTNVDLDSAAVRLRFIGGIDAKLTEINNKNVPTEILSKLSGVGEGNTATFELPELVNGLYAVDWAVNEIGGHGNNSTIVFKVLKEPSDSNYIILVVVLTIVVILFSVGYFINRRKIA